MFNFVVRRLAVLPLVLAALIAVVVGLSQLLSVEQRASAYITNEQQMRNMDRIIRARGLDQPFHVQYWKWIENAFQGDLGSSKVSGQTVVDTFKSRFPATLELALYSSLPIIGFCIWLGTLAALRKDKLVDQITRVFVVIAGNLPVFVLGTVFLVFFYGQLGILPGPGQVSAEANIEMITNPLPTVTGMLTIDALIAGRFGLFWDGLKHLILPAFTLMIVLGATLVKATRSNLLEVLRQDYVRTARSKGLPETVVHLKHARRNALMPVVTIGSNLVFIGLLQGALFTETMYARPGIGSWIGDAAARLDFGGVLGAAFFIGVIVVIGNLIADIMYTLVDPRVRFD